MLYICSVDVGLHLEKQSISILSIFILEAGSSDASRSHLIDHLSLFRQFSEKFAGNVSLLYLCSDGKSPVVKFYISKSVSCFKPSKGNRQISTQITEDKAVKRTLMLVAYPLPATRGDSISDKAWEWTVYFVIGVWRYLFGNKPRNCPRFFCAFQICIYSVTWTVEPKFLRATFHSIATLVFIVVQTVTGCH